jgi:hypothetical protein
MGEKMSPEEKRDLIRFITDRVMVWFVDDWGEYCNVIDGSSTGYSKRQMLHRIVFDPIGDANCRDMVVKRMAELGFWSKQMVLIDRDNQTPEYAVKFISTKDEATGGYGSTESMGIAVCKAAQRAILRQEELRKEVKKMIPVEREYHGN